MSTKTQTDKETTERFEPPTNDETNPSTTDRRGDPWRLRCPNGHTSWQRAADGYICETGRQIDDSCSRFDALVDWKTREKVQR